MLLAGYADLRQRLKDVASGLLPMLRKTGLEAEAEELTTTIQRLDENRFNVVVMGEQKRGKSTLVNALLHRPEMMPSGLKPVSSAIVSIRHGEKESATIHFKHPHRESVGLEGISDYCVEERNPGNEKGVSEIEVTIPHPWLEDGVCFVDTPGTGSVKTYHTELAYKHIPVADVILFVFTAELPVGRGEFEYLEEIGKQGRRKVLFVLNKADRLAADEAERVLQYNLDKVREIDAFKGIEKTDFLKVSARVAIQELESGGSPGNASGVPALERQMERLINEERASIAIRHAASSIQRAIRSLRQFFENKATLAKKSLEEIQKRQEECELKKGEKEKSFTEMAEYLRVAVRKAKRQFADKSESLDPILSEYFSEVKQLGHLTSAEVVEDIQQRIEKTVLQELRKNAEQVVNETVAPAIKDIDDRVQEELEELVRFHAQFSESQWSSMPLSAVLAAGTAAGGAAILTSGQLASGGLIASSINLIVGPPLITVLAPVGAILLALSPVILDISTRYEHQKKRDRKVLDLKAKARKMCEECVDQFSSGLDAIAEDAGLILKRQTRVQMEPVEQALRMARAEREGLESGGDCSIEEQFQKCEKMESALQAVLDEVDKWKPKSM